MHGIPAAENREVVMRYLVGFGCALALLVSPLSAGAQERGETSEPNVVEAVPTSEATPEERALQLQLDDAGVQVASPPPRTPDGYTLEEMERRVKRAKIGLGVSAGVYGLGLGLTIGGVACANNAPPPTRTLL